MTDDGPAASVGGSNAYRRYVLILLLIANSFNMIDRVAMNLLIEPIRREFGFSDFQLAMVAGFGFAAFHAVFGIPIASLADRTNRRNLLGIGILIWSAMTVLTGRAAGFASMMAIRVAVGVGEATCYPAAVPMIGDIFPKAERSRAIAVFQTGAFVGVVVGAFVVGMTASHFGWRAAFTALGIPGIVLAIVLFLTVREPPRGGAEIAAPGHPPAGGFGFGQAVRLLADNRRFRLLFVAAALLWTGASVLIIWGPALLMRLHGLDEGQVGTMAGPILGSGGIVGTLLGGVLSARMVRRSGDARAPLRIVEVGALLGLPATVLFVFAPSLPLAMFGGAAAGFLSGMISGPLLAAAIELVPAGQRGLSASLIVVFAQQLLGLGISPLLVGLASDATVARLGVESLRWAMLIPCLAIVAGWFAAMRATASSSAPDHANTGAY